jgi:hypothetical protein
MNLNLVSPQTSGYYNISLKFFDFSIDYIELLPVHLIKQLKDRAVQILFYYDEGDNPFRIKYRLDELCNIHLLPTDCYRFISANTAADQIPGFAYFPGDELLYWLRNRNVPACVAHKEKRQRDFTVLSRTHKWWRATAMTDLYRQGLLNNSYWSYNTRLSLNEDPSSNPIAIGNFAGLQQAVDNFLLAGPYAGDNLTATEHNDHTRLVSEHFTDSYCNIVLETHFDADSSGGVFLTEKIFKPIKHGQPFIIVGAPGSLAALRTLGYRTFDQAIDNSYDLEQDNTRRWRSIVKAVQEIHKQNLQEWFLRCWDDVQHNQQLFAHSKKSRLNTLHDKLLY